MNLLPLSGVLVSILGIVVVGSHEPVAWDKTLFPNPQKDPVACGRMSSSYVCDPQGLISKVQGNKHVK